MTKVIAAIDNSATAAPVLAAAKALAPVLGADVEAVFIAGEEGRTARASAAASDVPFHCQPGDPVTELVLLGGADDVAAVVVGSRNRPTGRRTGHLALALADQLDKPVLVVPPGATPPARMEHVLIGMEGSAQKEIQVKRAVEVASAVGLDLVIVHVDDETTIPSFDDQVAHETEAYSKEFLARYLPGAPQARLELRIGVPADELLAAAAEESPDIVAVGWPQGHEPGRGDVARELLDRCPVPVLLVATA